MKGYGIYIKNDLLEPKHVEAIGTALWEYLWCLDKITSIDEAGVGKVLGGKPIRRSEIKADLGISERYVAKRLRSLETSGYINLTRTDYGFIITVNKSKKIFGKEKLQKVTSSVKREVTQMVQRSDVFEQQSTKSGNSNKTRQDNTNNTILPTTTEHKVYDAFVSSFGFAPTKAKQTNLNSIKRILEKNNKTAAELIKIIGFASSIQGERYAPAINNFWDIEDKYPDILRFYASKKKRSIRSV